MIEAPICLKGPVTLAPTVNVLKRNEHSIGKIIETLIRLEF
jgi:hypothetical protein